MDIYEQKLLAAIKQLRPNIKVSGGYLIVRYPNGTTARVALPNSQSVRQSTAQKR